MKARNKFDNCGVSETIGFVIVLGIVMTSIGMVYINGFPALTSMKTSTNLDNTQNSFSLLQDNIQTITHENVNSRSTKIKLNGGGLNLDNRGTQFNVSIIKNNNDQCPDQYCNTTVRSLVFEKKTQKVVYENGGYSDSGLIS